MENNDKLTAVFVYGTLKQGGSNHHLLESSEFVEYSYVDDMVAINTPGFPYAIDKDGGHLLGELYRVDEATFRRLDMLEGYPRHYERKEVDVFGIVNSPSTNPPVKAWVYYVDADKYASLVNRYGICSEWEK